jgi:hypothetical protein
MQDNSIDDNRTCFCVRQKHIPLSLAFSLGSSSFFATLIDVVVVVIVLLYLMFERDVRVCVCVPLDT